MTTRPDRAKRKAAGSIDVSWENTVRHKIRTSQILNRLISYIKGEITLESGQVTAALGLLRKALPDLATVEHKGEVSLHYVAEMPKPIESLTEWEKNYAGQPTAH